MPDTRRFSVTGSDQYYCSVACQFLLPVSTWVVVCLLCQSCAVCKINYQGSLRDPPRGLRRSLLFFAAMQSSFVVYAFASVKARKLEAATGSMRPRRHVGTMTNPTSHSPRLLLSPIPSARRT